MSAILSRSIVLAATLLVVGIPAALAQNATPAPPAPPVPKPFSFGDLMDTLVQPRHVKLALAGRAQNWPLAAYALHQLKDPLSNVAESRPRFRNQSVPELMAGMTGEPLEALDRAIKAGDAQQFTEALCAAYRRLQCLPRRARPARRHQGAGGLGFPGPGFRGQAIADTSCSSERAPKISDGFSVASACLRRAGKLDRAASAQCRI